MQKEHVICPSDYTVSDWSGGQTTQLYIVPHGGDFRQRKFDFRISSATFTSTESEFSDFTGYRRYLFPLNGWLTVNHDDLGELRLEPYEVNHFSGSSKTFSRNSADCKDFNFIVRDGLDSKLTIRNTKWENGKAGSGSDCVGTLIFECAANSTTCIFSLDGFTTRIARRADSSPSTPSNASPDIAPNTCIRNEISAGGLYVLETTEPCEIKIIPGKEPLVICQVFY